MSAVVRCLSGNDDGERTMLLNLMLGEMRWLLGEMR